MKIELQKIKVKDLVNGYERDEENESIVGYGGRLNIRPKYQREFVYDDKKRNAVIDTIFKGFPLNTMYWVKQIDENGETQYEVLDGQQRTISICDYFKGDFSLNEISFHNLQNDEKERFLNYELMVYICEGGDKEKLDWFAVINIAGEKLTNQELRNAVYASEWLSDAKRRFSKRNSLAYQKGGNYLKGKSDRQEFLETAIAWIANKRDDKTICEYMDKCAKCEKNADELWLYFQRVIEWIEVKFTKYRKEMQGLEWGLFYNKYKDKKLDSNELEAKITQLMQDEDIKKKSGIYEYLLSGNEKHLNLRAFDDKTKREVFEAQNGNCKKCGVKCELEQMEADHITPWSKGGKTQKENCQMLCKDCNRSKSDK